jgi:hypothetical protein
LLILNAKVFGDRRGEKRCIFCAMRIVLVVGSRGLIVGLFVTQDSASAETFFANFSVEVPNQYDASRAGAVSWKAGERQQQL